MISNICTHSLFLSKIKHYGYNCSNNKQVLEYIFQKDNTLCLSTAEALSIIEKIYDNPENVVFRPNDIKLSDLEIKERDEE